jgi:DNA polymerase-3 subunit beta
MKNLINQLKGNQNMKNILEYLNIAKLSAATQDVRYYLNGVLTEREDQNMKLISTDGHRMTVINMGESRGDNTNCIIENETITALNAYKRESFNFNLADGQVNFSFNHNRINLSTKGIDGEFPDWKRVFRDYESDSLGYHIHNVKGDIETLKTLSKGVKYQKVTIAIIDNNLGIFKNTELFPEGTPHITVRAAYIIDVLKQFQMLNKLNQTSEMLIKIPKDRNSTVNFMFGNITTVVMPVRV